LPTGINFLVEKAKGGSDEAIDLACRLASCGAAMAAALRLAAEKEFAGRTVVVILPDSGERYLTASLFEGIFDEAGLPREK
jgi:cysteine synthase A